MERASQGRFIPDRSSNEFVITKPLPTNCFIRMYGTTEVYVLNGVASRELLRQANEDKIASQDKFYAENPHLHGEKAYVAWLSHESDQ